MSEYILLGLTNVLTPENLLAVLAGTVLGLFVGAMPGLSATMAIALLLPLTFSMEPATGISMLASLYLAAMYGGSIAAILLRTPGTPAAAATVVDGYPLAAQGKAGKALGVSLTASFIGGSISVLGLMTIAPTLGMIVLEFGPVEMFSVAVLGITIIASLSQGSTIRGLFAGAVGLLLAMVGMDVTTGTPRFTYGFMNLFEGIPFTVALIGLFSIPQAIRLIQADVEVQKLVSKVTDRMLPTLAEFKHLLPNMVRSGVIGMFTGLVPGAGGDTACWFAYNEAKRFSKHKEKFGTGFIDGIAAPEAANNAVVGGALVPTISLRHSGQLLDRGAHGGADGPRHPAGTDPDDRIRGRDLYADLGSAVCQPGPVRGRFGLHAGQRLCDADPEPGDRADHRRPVRDRLVRDQQQRLRCRPHAGLRDYRLCLRPVAHPDGTDGAGLILGPLLDGSLHQALLIGDDSYFVFIESPISAGLLAVAVFSILQSSPAGGWLAKPFRALFKRRTAE